MFERFTEGACHVLIDAQEMAVELGQETVGCEHLLLAIGSSPSEVGAALNRLGFGPSAVRPLMDLPDEAEEPVRRLFGRKRRCEAGSVPFTPHARQCLEGSLREADELDAERVGEGHMALAIFETDDPFVAEIARKADVDSEHVRATLLEAIGPTE